MTEINILSWNVCWEAMGDAQKFDYKTHKLIEKTGSVPGSISCKPKKCINNVNDLIKKEIMNLISEKMNGAETMQPMPAKAKKGHNGIPEFMTYDAISSSSSPAVAPTNVVLTGFPVGPLTPALPQIVTLPP